MARGLDRLLKRFANRRLGLLVIILGVGCANIYTSRGVYHRVQPGETFDSLVEKYAVSAQDIAELNNIENPKELKVGFQLFIPGVRAQEFKRKPRWKEGAKGMMEQKGGKRVSRIEVDHGRFIWPLKGRPTSHYGVRRGRRHDGIDIKAPRGTVVLAAADGKVVFSKRLRGYGNLILLRHVRNFFTVYAHNSVNLVKKGARVKRGQAIAKVGTTGRSTGPHLHFEVREGRKARNPLFFLPKR